MLMETAKQKVADISNRVTSTVVTVSMRDSKEKQQQQESAERVNSGGIGVGVSKGKLFLYGVLALVAYSAYRYLDVSARNQQHKRKRKHDEGNNGNNADGEISIKRFKQYKTRIKSKQTPEQNNSNMVNELLSLYIPRLKREQRYKRTVVFCVDSSQASVYALQWAVRNVLKKTDLVILMTVWERKNSFLGNISLYKQYSKIPPIIYVYSCIYQRGLLCDI